MSQGVDNQDMIAGGNQHRVLGKRFLGAAGLPKVRGCITADTKGAET